MTSSLPGLSRKQNLATLGRPDTPAPPIARVVTPKCIGNRRPVVGGGLRESPPRHMGAIIQGRYDETERQNPMCRCPQRVQPTGHEFSELDYETGLSIGDWPELPGATGVRIGTDRPYFWCLRHGQPGHRYSSCPQCGDGVGPQRPTTAYNHTRYDYRN